MNNDLTARFDPKPIKTLAPELQLWSARFSPCGKILAAGGMDGTVRRWDVSDPKTPELAPLTGHESWVQTIAFVGSRIVSGDSWGTLIARDYADTADAKAVWKHAAAHDGWLRQIAVSSDGSRIATCGRDQAVRVWLAADGKKELELVGHNQDVFCLAFHPDGKSLISGDLMGGIKHWDLASGKVVRTFDAKVLCKSDRLQDIGGVRCLRFDAAGETFGAAGTKPKNGGNVQGLPTIQLFDWKTGKAKEIVSFGVDGDALIYDFEFHPAGFLIGVSSGNPGIGKLFLTRVGDAAPFVLNSKMANCLSMALHPDGKRLVVTGTNSGSNGNGRQLDKNGKYAGNRSPVHLLEFPKAG